MKLIKEIFNETIGLTTTKKDRAYNLARASRVVLFNKENEIAILNVTSEGYHKLPGGKIELNETREEAAYREITEETGYEFNIEDELGLIIEYSDDTRFMQISFAYIGRVKNYIGKSLSEREKKQALKLEWISLDKAINILKQEKPNSYHGKFIVNRDLCFLEEAKLLIDNKK